MLANQVSVVVHDLEQKRVDCLKTQQKLKRERENKIRTFKVCILIFLIYIIFGPKLLHFNCKV